MEPTIPVGELPQDYALERAAPLILAALKIQNI
jgi:hypothetical protein